MKSLSNFTVCMTMVVIMIIGIALIPRLDVGVKPPPEQGKTLTVTCSRKGASAKVMENSVTSVIEGILSGVKGVESVTSESFFGRCRIRVQMKKTADVTAARFEMSSLLRRIYSRLPEGTDYPSLSGGEVVNGSDGRNERLTLLTYYVNADMPEEEISECLENGFIGRVRQIGGVENVSLSGGSRHYMELSYDPLVLAGYGITSADIADAVRNFTGREDIVGDVTTGDDTRHTLIVTSGGVSIADIPVTTPGGDVIYLNSLVTQTEKKRAPDRYYRINGLNTVNISVDVAGDANAISLSSYIQREVDRISTILPAGMYLTLAHDAAEEERVEVGKLVNRSLLSLAVLLLFVWITRREWKYLFIIVSTLALNILFAIIIYWFLGLKLHVFSMAGMAVSMSLIIDSTIVMTDHYSYYRDRKAFLAILAAMLTTVGSLVSVWFLPEEWQRDLYDFARIISINLAVSLIVALIFVPALIGALHYDSTSHCRIHRVRCIAVLSRMYFWYVRMTQRRKWIAFALMAVMFGVALDWFADNINGRTNEVDEQELSLVIRGELPLGGTALELNRKVVMVEDYLKSCEGIKCFTTRIDGRGAYINVDFTDSCLATSLPYIIEQKVIGKLIGIGGSDWSTYGVSRMGFSNSLNLQHRSNCIWITGYNYDCVNRYAEEIARYIGANPRTRDVVVRVPDRNHEADELYMRYDHERMALYGIGATDLHSSLANLITTLEVGVYDNGAGKTDVVLKSVQTDMFDKWQIDNSYIRTGGHLSVSADRTSVDDRDIKVSDIADVSRREAKNCIPKRNQEYILSVEFNVLGSYVYVSDFMKDVVDHFNGMLPMGYRCVNPVYKGKSDKEAPYWVIGIVVVVVFFICAILFESLCMPLTIIFTIPVSFIGLFLTFAISGVPFGTGGLASMVMLAGIVVNSAIYILNEYSIFKTRMSGRRVSDARIYVKAYNHKIIPVLLTISSTVIGLVPFFFDGGKEPFWLSFATGVTGGLLFSVIVIQFALPIFVRLRK
ncbi:efflux RND transporter permease subunit [Xylanibacter muris]|uniref:Efflux RND transporter permease subunit n=2 Tax=Xylanibacter muris TaxID=2736290 RepID=A0ABX2AN18_9BACT|nr:efflux RND transporter permease subunit [Xylanibacter muris]NPD91619.1 efflux RND transporter permease subunit [Xylanibacter muris]